MNDSHDTDTAPTEAAAEKPEMGYTEASFHAACAGVTAAKKSAKDSNNPQAVEALGEHAAGGKAIGGVDFQRPSIKSNYAVTSMHKLFTGVDMTPETNTGLFLLAFAQPRITYRLACIDKDQPAKEQLIKLADLLMLELDYEEVIAEARDWCQDAHQRLMGVKKPSPSSTKSTEPEPGKTDSDSTDSSAPETEPEAPAG